MMMPLPSLLMISFLIAGGFCDFASECLDTQTTNIKWSTYALGRCYVMHKLSGQKWSEAAILCNDFDVPDAGLGMWMTPSLIQWMYDIRGSYKTYRVHIGLYSFELEAKRWTRDHYYFGQDSNREGKRWPLGKQSLGIMQQDDSATFESCGADFCKSGYIHPPATVGWSDYGSSTLTYFMCQFVSLNRVFIYTPFCAADPSRKIVTSYKSRRLLPDYVVANYTNVHYLQCANKFALCGACNSFAYSKTLRECQLYVPNDEMHSTKVWNEVTQKQDGEMKYSDVMVVDQKFDLFQTKA